MPQKIAKYDLLKLIQDIWQKKDVSILPFDEYFCDKSMVISCNEKFNYSAPDDYRVMLNDLKKFCDENNFIDR